MMMIVAFWYLVWFVKNAFLIFVTLSYARVWHGYRRRVCLSVSLSVCLSRWNGLQTCLALPRSCPLMKTMCYTVSLVISKTTSKTSLRLLLFSVKIQPSDRCLCIWSFDIPEVVLATLMAMPTLQSLGGIVSLWNLLAFRVYNNLLQWVDYGKIWYSWQVLAYRKNHLHGGAVLVTWPRFLNKT